MTLDGAGNVYACDFGNAVLRISGDGVVTTHSTGTPERPMRVPNFAAFDDSGNLYVTDSGEWADDDGLVYRVAPGGATEVWTDAASRFPNGCCLTAAGDALLVVESHGRAIVRIPFEDDGAAGRPEPVADLGGSQPDGIALAEDGTMLVGCYRPDRIYEISSDGRVGVFAEDADGVILNQPANVAFVGRSSTASSSRASAGGAWSRPPPDAAGCAALSGGLSDRHLGHERQVVPVRIGEERHPELPGLLAVYHVRLAQEPDATFGERRVRLVDVGDREVDHPA